MISTKRFKWNDMTCTALSENSRNIIVADDHVEEWEEWLETWSPEMTEEDENEWANTSPPLIAKMSDFDGVLINPHGTVVGIWCDLEPLDGG